MALIFVSGVAHFFMGVGGSKIHERLAHFFIDIYSYPGATARVERNGDLLRIYSADLKVLLATHTVTWSRTDSFCEGQYESLTQPEEFPTASVQTQILQLPKPSQDLSFAKFDFDKEDQV